MSPSDESPAASSPEETGPDSLRAKITKYEKLPEGKRKYYQREQRIEEKQRFRKRLRDELGPGFKKVVESVDKYGLTAFKDFMNPTSFRVLQAEYDKMMQEEGASNSTFGFNFANLLKRPGFLLNKEFKDAFFHPLLIGVIAHQTGGPVRLVDARAKNAGSEETMVRDNRPHLDDNPFSDEWKLLISWSIGEDEKSKDRGPEGQAFVSFPGTEKFVRSEASEYGANFKDPKELLHVLQSPELKEKIFGIEGKSDRPLSVIFEASHQVHHRKRSTKEPGRACYIESFHIVDPRHNPPPYLPAESREMVTDPLDRFLLCGEGGEEDFLVRLFSHKGKIEEIEQEHRHVEAHEKMMTPLQLVKYLQLMIDTYKREAIHSRQDLRIKKEDITEAKKTTLVEKLRSSIAERDKHYDLDLRVYPDQREQHRKKPRTRIRERHFDGTDEKEQPLISDERFKKLTLPEVSDDMPPASEVLSTYAESFKSFSASLEAKLLSLSGDPSLEEPEFKELIRRLSSEDPFPESVVSALLKTLNEKNPKLAETVYMYQLIKDLTEAFDRLREVKGMRANAYFVYLVYDEILRTGMLAGRDEGLEEEAQALLQKYFEFVVHDDLTYLKAIQSQEISEDEIYEKIAGVLTREETNLKVSETMPPKSTLFSQTLFFKAKEKQFPKEAREKGPAIEECYLYEAMLEEAAANTVIKEACKKFANTLNTKLQVIIDEVHKAENLDVLPDYIKKCIDWVANEHSSSHNQRLGLMRGTPREEIILGGKETMLTILRGMQARLLKLNEKTDLNSDDIAEAVKSINDVAFCYIEYFPLEQKSEHFELSAQIMPSPEESAARIKRDEAILYERGSE